MKIWHDESELGRQMAEYEQNQKQDRDKQRRANKLRDRRPHYVRPKKKRKALPAHCEAGLKVLREAKQPMPQRDLYGPTGLTQYEVQGALNTLKSRRLARVAGTMPMGEGRDRLNRLDLINTYVAVPEGGDWGQTK